MTIAYPMAIGACVTMALIHLRTGLRRTPGAAHLLFSLNASVVAVYSCFELALAAADSPAQYLALMRWLDIMAALQVVSIAAFVWVFFSARRKWLAFLGPGLSCASLIPDLLPEPKLVYLQITGIKKLQTFGGVTYTVAEGVRNPWNAVFYLGVLLLVVFVADASVTLWRQGARQRAAVVGGTITLFCLVGGVQAALADAGIMRTPYLLSFVYLAILAAMGMELSDDVLRAAQLARDLQESEARMTLAVEAGGIGLWMWAIPRNQVWGSEKWLRLFGFAPGDTVDFDKVIQRIHPDDRETVEREVRRALEDQSDYTGEYRLLLPDKTLRWVAARGRMVQDLRGKPVRMLGTAIDVTELKQAEQEIVQQRNELAHLSRVNMLGELAGSLAHELNQPLTAILSNAQAAQRFLAQDQTDPNEIRDILADIVTEDKRASEVIRRLRPLLKKGEVQRQPLQVNEVVHEVLKFMRNDLLNHGVTFQTDLAQDLPVLHGDRVQLQQVLVNLVMNACDAMSGAAQDNRALLIRTGLAGGDFVCVSVADCGEGIAPEKLEQVFDPFYTTKPHGLGLGLAVCRTIITAHGGKLWATDNRGRGATFHFTLPVTQGETSQ